MKKLFLSTIIAAATAGTLFAFFQPKAELSATHRQNVEALSSDEEPFPSDILDKHCTDCPFSVCIIFNEEDIYSLTRRNAKSI